MSFIGGAMVGFVSTFTGIELIGGWKGAVVGMLYGAIAVGVLIFGGNQ